MIRRRARPRSGSGARGHNRAPTARTAARAGRTSDSGVATVWAAAAVAVLTTVLAACLHLGAALLARHRAESAADLAALAAAREAVRGEAPACRRAVEIAAAMGGEVARCRLVGWNALVEVRVVLPFALPGLTTASGRAMAGPSTAGQARVGERSMGTAGRAAAARAVARGRAAPLAGRFAAPMARSSLQQHQSATAPWLAAPERGPTGAGSRWPRPVQEPRSVAPQTAVGPERRLTPTPEPAAPRRAAAVPPAPPTGRAGGGLPQPAAVAERVQHDIQHPHGARLVQRRVAVAALGRLHARRTAGAALAAGDRRAGGGEPARQRSCPRSANPAPPGCPS